jgi:hypothetical protein
MEMPSLNLLTSFSVGDVQYSSTLEDDLHIDNANIAEAYLTHSNKFAFYATAYELALDHETRMKARLDQVYALLDEQARQELQAKGLKVTEKMVENVVITSDDYKTTQERYFEAKKNTGLLRASKDAMMARKDMLVSLGANYRAEINSDPTLLTQAKTQANIAAYKASKKA